MGKKLGVAEEAKLTKAIEKAASLATVNPALNRNELLVQQLNDADIDKRFAKVASNAFNKRITVCTLEKTADEHKAESFPLVDPEIVFSMMGGELLSKAASMMAPVIEVFEIGFGDPFAIPEMRKAASAYTLDVTPCQYEERVDVDIMQDHLESMLDKSAADYSILVQDAESIDSSLNRQAAEISEYLSKSASGETELDRLVDIYGPGFAADLMDRMPKVAMEDPYGKQIEPDIGIYGKAAKFVEDTDMYNTYCEYIENCERDMDEMCKAAAAAPTASAYGFHAGGMSNLRANVADLGSAAYHGANDALMNGLSGLTGAIQQTGDALTGAITNSLGILDAAKKRTYSPYDFVDADFIKADRSNDRLMAWSDMTADPIISKYPSDQILSVTNTLLNSSSDLERPENREMLRVQVAQTLAQNGRLSTADQAALATTMRYLNQGRRDSLAANAAERVRTLESVNAPETPEEISKAITAVNTAAQAGLGKLNETFSASAKESGDRLVELSKDNRKRLRDRAAAERKREEDAEEKRAEAIAKFTAAENAKAADGKRVASDLSESKNVFDNLGMLAKGTGGNYRGLDGMRLLTEEIRKNPSYYKSLADELKAKGWLDNKVTANGATLKINDSTGLNNASNIIKITDVIDDVYNNYMERHGL